MDGLPRQLEHGCETCRREKVGRTFFIQGKGWTNAESLSNGDVSPTWASMKKSGGLVEKEIVFSGQQDTISDRVSGLVIKESLAVVDIEVIEEETTVYNFEVEDDHTYFVTDAEVWVHNADSYTVQKGERVQMVADKFGVSKEDLLDANPKAKARGYFLAGEDIDVPSSSDASLADKLLSFGNELKEKWDSFNLEELNPFKKSDPPPTVGDVSIYPIKQENLSLKSVGTQLDNIYESCVLATTTILISNEKGEFIDINDAYIKGNKIGAVVPGKQERKNGRTTGVNVKDPSALAKSFGVDKNMTIDNVSPGSNEMRKILNEQLQNGKPAGVYLGSSNNLRHMEVVTGTVKLGNQTVYKLHDVGFQKDQYLDPNNCRPFKVENDKWIYSTNKGAPRSVDRIWRFK